MVEGARCLESINNLSPGHTSCSRGVISSVGWSTSRRTREKHSAINSARDRHLYTMINSRESVEIAFSGRLFNSVSFGKNDLERESALAFHSTFLFRRDLSRDFNRTEFATCERESGSLSSASVCLEILLCSERFLSQRRSTTRAHVGHTLFVSILDGACYATACGKNDRRSARDFFGPLLIGPTVRIVAFESGSVEVIVIADISRHTINVHTSWEARNSTKWKKFGFSSSEMTCRYCKVD